MISLLPDKLYLRFHTDKAETVRDTALHKGVFFFSSAHDQNRPSCRDFGPIDVNTVATICRDLRALLANPLRGFNRPIVCYCYHGKVEQTNAAFTLASYMMLVEGRTPEQAWAPFARVKPSPWVNFKEVTQETSELDISILIDLLQIRRIHDAARRAQDSLPSKNTRSLLRCSAPGPRPLPDAPTEVARDTRAGTMVAQRSREVAEVLVRKQVSGT